MTTREAVELKGKFNARVIDETDDTWTVRVLGAFDLVVHKGDGSLSPHLKNEGFWESWITTWVCNSLEPGMTFIDVGANCGYYTMLAESLGANVVTYEPNPEYVLMLEDTWVKNSANFVIRPLALSDRPGEVTLSVPDTLHGSASIVTDFVGSQWGGTNWTVAAVRLDDDLKNLSVNPYILKIDAESAEEMVWHGAKGLLESDRKGVVMLEWTPNSYSEGFMDELLAWGDVTMINHSGQEEAVPRRFLDSLSDWIMLVIRKR